MFGSILQANFLMNMATRDGIISKIIRGTYVFILLFNTPYKFFLIKELTLVMYDEAVSRSLSNRLDAKLKADY